MSSNVPSSLKYTKEHEWINLEGNTGIVGITDFAQSSLGDIVFVELPSVGSKVNCGKTFGVVESIKSVSDLYSPLSGEVIARNENVLSQPELINQSAYDNWLIKIRIGNQDELKSLLSSQDYQKLI